MPFWPDVYQSGFHGVMRTVLVTQPRWQVALSAAVYETKDAGQPPSLAGSGGT